MPINKNNSHWILAVVDNEKNKNSTYDSMKNKNHPQIKELNEAITRVINYDKEYDEPPEKPYKIIDVNDCPEQKDCNSCGIFVYKNIESQIFNMGRYNYSQDNINDIRAELKKKIINKMKTMGQKIINARDGEFLRIARLTRDRLLQIKGLKEEYQILE